MSQDTSPEQTDRTAPRVIRADARQNNERLVAAATAAFAERGPDASLEDIARRAGVGIGTLYRHFPTREVLMGAVVRERFAELTADAQIALGHADPFTGLAGWLRAYLAFSATKRGLVAGIVLMKEAGDPEFQQVCERMNSRIDALLRRAQEAGQVRTDLSSTDVIHLLSAISAGADHAGDPTMPGRLFDVAMDGLRVTSKTTAP